MEPVNLDNTRALNKIAEELGSIGKSLLSQLTISAGIAETQARIAEAETRGAEFFDAFKSRSAAEAKPAGAEKVQGVPILLIVEVLIALIRLLRLPLSQQILSAKLTELLKRLETYQPVRPAGKEAE